MKIVFRKIDRGTFVSNPSPNTVYLKVDYWNDFSFVTMFEVIAFDENAKQHDLPNVKIGFKGQTESTSTHKTLPDVFENLPRGYFSLGTDVEFYKVLSRDFSQNWRDEFLKRMADVVNNPEILSFAISERVFHVSHLRSVSINAVRNQFHRVLSGSVPSTDFHFFFELPASDTFAGFELEFDVIADSMPSTNIHAIIGRNGVGKTTVLNSMIKAISKSKLTDAKFYQKNSFAFREDLGNNFFSNMVSVAFSAFDPFDLPPAKKDPSNGTPYSYIGLTDYADEGGAIIKSREQIHEEFIQSLEFCLSEPARKKRWSDAVYTLESDGNFSEMNLAQLLSLDGDDLKNRALQIVKKMSSGHAIIILTLTQLVERVEEKSLVLIDEPESHLHPPLLSAFIRGLSQLLHRQNGVAIIATHSPVVLQEIPKSCVWKVFRSKTSSEWIRPRTETFGENVGTLTREVFGLELEKSGFHTLLEREVSRGGTFDEILDRFGGSLGYEAKGILRAMIFNRNTDVEEQ
ncbi:Phage protein ea59 [Azospirillum melinis]